MTRIRIVCQHDPLFAAGLITHRRERRPFRVLARAIARRLEDARRSAFPPSLAQRF